ncbi:hypothetical protein [Plantibacter sp. LMC-P-059a]|jgi:hypothetical protein|uniref:hypothetical protein n=1 Tax=Plantibacter sp. LMC-P-059a TaxID=3040297 RepID=UPI0025512390|nr:hypothetical protein [Plantibacter sp. LMC-P-059a]
MDARPYPDTVEPPETAACTDLKSLLRTVEFPLSRRELQAIAVRSGLDRGTIAALGTLTEERYAGSFAILRELRHHGELRHSA